MSWIEIDRVRKDPAEFRALASRLLRSPADIFTDWEREFLEQKVGGPRPHEYTTRQAEKLLQIRDGAALVETIHGFSVSRLICACYDARLDLAEDDEAFIVALRDRGVTSIRRSQSGRLLGCARALNIVEAA